MPKSSSISLNNFKLNTNVKDSPLKYKNFYHYSSLSNIDSIIKGKEIWFSNINKANNLEEKHLHKNDEKQIYIFCLCDSNTEKIPLWYMYSGIKGEGLALKITPGILLSILRNIKILHTDKDTILYKDKDFELKYGWIFYENKGKRSIYYKNKWYSKRILSSKIDNTFIKQYPWSYEKEFRICIVTKEKYDYLRLDISDIAHKLKVKLGPEIPKQVFNDLKKEYPGLSSLPIDSITTSTLKIKMNLVNKNFYDILNFIENDAKDEQINDIKNILEKRGL